jgi:hypothetical protein
LPWAHGALGNDFVTHREIVLFASIHEKRHLIFECPTGPSACIFFACGKKGYRCCPLAEVQELQLRRTSHIEERRALPVLRGFSRSVKQDSETSVASGGVNEVNVSPWRSTVRGTCANFRAVLNGRSFQSWAAIAWCEKSPRHTHPPMANPFLTRTKSPRGRKHNTNSLSLPSSIIPNPIRKAK